MTSSTAVNRQLRTRKDLLQAAVRLLKDGRELTMDAIAQEALVSRATAYRYFSDVDDVLTEAVIEDSAPDPQELFREMSPASIVERVDHAENVLHDYLYKNEAQLRIMLSRNMVKSKEKESKDSAPSRQNRRARYIEEALAPYRQDFDPKTYKRLSEALALVFGPEAMIVFKDVLGVGEVRAREIKRWALTSLINAALRENRAKNKKPPRA